MNYLHSLGMLPYVQICLWSLAECTDLKAVPRKGISRKEFESVTFESQRNLFSVACEEKKQKNPTPNKQKHQPTKNSPTKQKKLNQIKRTRPEWRRKR